MVTPKGVVVTQKVVVFRPKCLKATPVLELLQLLIFNSVAIRCSN